MLHFLTNYNQRTVKMKYVGTFEKTGVIVLEYIYLIYRFIILIIVENLVIFVSSIKYIAVKRGIKAVPALLKMQNRI